MENKLLYTQPLPSLINVKDVVVEDSESVALVFEDDSQMVIAGIHQRDCCESVYGDFGVAKYHAKDIIGKKFCDISIKGVPEMGFLICLDEEKYNGYGVKIFVPCYNCQNGYYSSDLALEVSYLGIKTKVDISDFVEDQID